MNRIFFGQYKIHKVDFFRIINYKSVNTPLMYINLFFINFFTFSINIICSRIYFNIMVFGILVVRRYNYATVRYVGYDFNFLTRRFEKYFFICTYCIVTSIENKSEIWICMYMIIFGNTFINIFEFLSICLLHFRIYVFFWILIFIHRYHI